MINFNSFIKYNVYKYIPIDKLLSIGNLYIIKNYQQNLDTAAYLISYDNYKLYFVDFNNNPIDIEIIYLQNYKIFNNNDKINIANNIFNNFYYQLINQAIELIYEYQLRNIHELNLNKIFNNFISRYKNIYEIIKKIYYKADFKLEIDKEKNFYLKWTKIL